MAGKHELEKFEYLFVDIEWNQTPGTNGIEDREPIQIGVVATDESMNLKKSFSRAMRLSSEEKYNPDTLVLSHSTLKSVMEANSEKIVLQKSIWTIKEWAGRRIGTLPFNYKFWHYTMPSLMQKY